MASHMANGGFASAKPSFAKVAAMAVPQAVAKPPPAISSKPGPNGRNNNPQAQSTSVPTGQATQKPNVHTEDIAAKTPKTTQLEVGIENAIEKLDLQIQKPADELPTSGTTLNHPKASSSSEDEQSHVSGSSSKLQGFDTKSIASVTTFQMDEKESLRPDDSASVQAADEEESTANSRVGSELGLATSKDLPRDISTKRGPVTLPGNAPRFGEIGPVQASTLSQNPALRQMSFISGERLPASEASPVPTIPDDKLLEAMNTPKDRLLLLQMEERIVVFLQQSKAEFLDLPPQNSFGRLLAHKVADYYGLEHYVGNDASIVRLFRTPVSRLSPPLNSYSNQLQNAAQQPAAAAFKIMRRAGPASGKASAAAGTPVSSSGPSKATSETGGDSNSEEGAIPLLDSAGNKDKPKLSREEREAQYEAARKRIFADVPETNEISAGGESSASISRSSSASGRKRSHKQRTPKDDSFEARSQFNAFYPGMNYPNNQGAFGRQQNVSYPQQYMPLSQANLAGSGYASPAASYQPFEHQPYNQMPQYPISPAQFGQQISWPMMQNEQVGSYYPYDPSNPAGPPMHQQSPNMSSSSMNQYSQAMQQYPGPSAHWMQSPYQNSFQQSAVGMGSAAVHWPNYPSSSAIPNMTGNSTPYQYGPYPQQFGPGTATGQHPLPGSFNRSVFNPQTRSFVPNTTISARFPVQNPSQSPPFNNSTQSRTNKSSSMTADLSPQGTGLPSRAAQPGSTNRNIQQSTANVPSSTLLDDTDSIQKKWGTPAHLPKKPPPSAVPSAFDIENTSPLPSQQQAFTGAGTTSLPKNSTGPLIMPSGGTTSQSHGTTAKVLAGGSS